MKRLQTIFLILLGLMLLGLVYPSAAQSVVVPVTIPVHGKLAISGNLSGTIVGPGDNQLLLVDTYSGDVEVLMQSDLGALAPVWAPNGNDLAFLNFTNGPAISMYDLVTRTFTDIVSTPGYSSAPQSWSPDGSQLLSISYSLSGGVGQYQLQRVNMSDGTATPLFTYIVDNPASDMPLPPGATVFNLGEIRQARWNPVYAEWILVQLGGYDNNLRDPVSGYPSSIVSTFLYNLQTAEKLSLDALFSARISTTPIHWNTDGRYLVLTTDEALRTTAIVSFENVNGVWTPQVVDGVRTLDEAAIDWLGVSDLLLSDTSEEANDDAIFHISQIINGVWFTTEFLRLPATTFDRIRDRDWHLTATEDEKRALSCLFDQAAMPRRLSIGARARVNFTDGTPLRLRAEPDFDAAEIMQMPEGTEFDVIGGPACVNATSYYRFWELRLDDGTTGWAAEANSTDYFIEPVN